jgi:hypothetical protein
MGFLHPLQRLLFPSSNRLIERALIIVLTISTFSALTQGKKEQFTKTVWFDLYRHFSHFLLSFPLPQRTYVCQLAPSASTSLSSHTPFQINKWVPLLSLRQLLSVNYIIGQIMSFMSLCVIRHHVISCKLWHGPYNVILFHYILRHIMSYHVIKCHFISFYPMSHHVISRHIMSIIVKSWYIMCHWTFRTSFQ